MATGADDGGGFFGGLAAGLTSGATDIVVPSPAVRQSASDAADRVSAQAGGYASSAVQGVRDVFAGALDEYHAQEDRAETWLRWGTVAFALLVLLVVVVVGAYFLAPVRKLIPA